MNIIWKRPDGGVSVTHLTDEAGTPREEAAKLLERGDIPAGWEVVATAIELPADRHFRDAWAWTTPDPVIDVCPIRAKEVTKARLRAERAPLLASLDMQYMRADENGDNAKKREVAAEKQRLRDITKQVDVAESLETLRALTV